MSSPTAVHVARGASYVVFQNIAVSVITALSFVILARLISPREMGIWAVLLLVAAFCQTLATIGLPQAVTKFVAENMSRGDAGTAASVSYQALRTSLILASSLAAIIFVAADPLATRLLGEKSYGILFQVLSFDVILYAGPIPVLVGTLLGLQKFRETAVIGVASIVIRQGLIIALIMLLGGFVGLVIGWAISDAGSALVYLAYVARALGKPRFDFSLHSLLGFSWPLFFGQVANFAQTWFDRAVLVVFVQLSIVGVYNATITAFNVLVGVATAIASTLLPAYSTVYDTGHREGLGKAVGFASRYVSFTIVPLALGLLATAMPALTVFVGEAYGEGAEPLMLLSFVFALTAFGTSALVPALLSLEETGTASAITTTSVIVSFMVAFLLIPSYGMIGASLSRGVAMILATVLMMLTLRRRFELRLSSVLMAKPLMAGVVMAAAVWLVQILAYSKYLLPFYVGLGVVIYLAMLRLLKAVTQRDIDLISGYFGHRYRFIAKLLTRILL